MDRTDNNNNISTNHGVEYTSPKTGQRVTEWGYTAGEALSVAEAYLGRDREAQNLSLGETLYDAKVVQRPSSALAPGDRVVALERIGSTSSGLYAIPEGTHGTVTDIQADKGWVRVEWDNGKSASGVLAVGPIAPSPSPSDKAWDALCDQAEVRRPQPSLADARKGTWAIRKANGDLLPGRFPSKEDAEASAAAVRSYGVPVDVLDLSALPEAPVAGLSIHQVHHDGTVLWSAYVVGGSQELHVARTPAASGRSPWVFSTWTRGGRLIELRHYNGRGLSGLKRRLASYGLR